MYLNVDQQEAEEHIGLVADFRKKYNTSNINIGAAIERTTSNPKLFGWIQNLSDHLGIPYNIIQKQIDKGFLGKEYIDREGNIL